MGKFQGSLYRIVLAGLFIGLQGCAALHSQDFGRFSPDREVSQAFERYQVNPGMNYYISGSEVHPNALMGLDKNYVLESTLWKRVEMTPARLKEIVTDMKSKTSTIHQSLFGFSLIDPQGKPVGIWYSILSARTAFQMKENNQVMILTPDLRTYEKFEDGFRGLGP